MNSFTKPESMEIENISTHNDSIHKIFYHSLSRINFIHYLKNFTFFIVFRNCDQIDEKAEFTQQNKLSTTKMLEFKVSRFVADLVSPIVNNFHKVDHTIDSFEVQIDLTLFREDYDKEDFSISEFHSYLNDIFYNWGKLSNKTDSSKSQKHMKLVYLTLFFLGNKEYFSEIYNIDSIGTNKLNSQNVFQHLQKKQNYYAFLTRTQANPVLHNDDDNRFLHKTFYNKIYFEDEINFISRHFYSIEVDKLEIMPAEIIFDIVSNKNLCLENETQLYLFIKRMISISSDYYSLLSFVDFTYLSNDDIYDFISSFNIEYLNSSIWSRICLYSDHNHKYIPKNIHDHNKRYNQNSSFYIPFTDLSKQYMNGVTSFLANYHHGNNYDTEIIGIEASTHEGGDLYDLVSQAIGSDFYRENEKNSWILFDFKNYRINLEYYSIRSYKAEKYGHHPRNWVMEASNDKKAWKTIDERANDTSLNGSSLLSSFEIKDNANNNCSRYLRIHLTGKNWNDQFYLDISSIEFYGTLLSDQSMS
ncbi:hypothetical protein TRFO_10583 [Tritrichomonas foetus]|uniref:Uncharacterized protein n=1 Tax=Tritrichomonas foetus TaxID=1144522 RepID=A0A1J4J8B9_9EUKA|nr:hypothetical protein TRFO_10583 [Tritrichomonas foetus]|eukprot:OHS95422.1 hypothetical protein TRFO_10583 [Tritrichomonas foetus]